MTVFHVMALLAAAAALSVWPGPPAHARQPASPPGNPDFTLEAIHRRGIYAGRFFEAGVWDREGPRQWFLVHEDGSLPGAAPDIVVRDLITGRQKQVVGSHLLKAPHSGRTIKVESVEPSPDGRWLLLLSSSGPEDRAGKEGRYHVFDLRTRRVLALSPPDQAPEQFAAFSPQSHSVAFVRGRDLFVFDLASEETVRVTDAGQEDGIMNGTSYGVTEEAFGTRSAFAWSPDGTRLAWLQLQVSRIPKKTGGVGQDGTLAAGAFRIPDAGGRNAEARVCSASWKRPMVSCLETGTWDPDGEDASASDPSLPEYLVQLGWTKEGEPRIWTLRMNRAQDRVDLLVARPDQPIVDTLHTDVSAHWLDIREGTVTFLSDGGHYLWLGPRNGQRHLSLCPIGPGACRPVTQGAWEVADLVGLDPDERTAYVLSAMDDPLERHLYAMDLTGQSAIPRRLTHEPGVHKVSLSRDGAWYIDEFSDARTPLQWVLRSTSGGPSWPLEENFALRKLLGRMALPQAEAVSLPAADGTPLNAWIQRPSRFDSTRAWPVLFHVYGGPDSQVVMNAWDQGVQRQLWHAWVAETLGVVVVRLDPRGTGGRGRDFAGQVKGQLGPVVADDLAAAARHLGARSWVDAERMGIWGWSYGGFATLMAMLGPADSPFRVGVALAPVTDFRHYDTPYSERYLSTPQAAPEAYDASSVVALAHRLRPDQHLLLVHGDADENVDIQHTLRLADALQAGDRPFDLMIYPGRAHSLTGRGTRLHLFSMISRYIQAHLVRTLDEAGSPRSDPE